MGLGFTRLVADDMGVGRILQTLFPPFWMADHLADLSFQLVISPPFLFFFRVEDDLHLGTSSNFCWCFRTAPWLIISAFVHLPHMWDVLGIRAVKKPTKKPRQFFPTWIPALVADIPLLTWNPQLYNMGMSENGVYPQWNSNLKTGLWSLTIVFRGTQHFQTHPYMFFSYFALGEVTFVEIPNHSPHLHPELTLQGHSPSGVSSWQLHRRTGLHPAGLNLLEIHLMKLLEFRNLVRTDRERWVNAWPFSCDTRSCSRRKHDLQQSMAEDVYNECNKIWLILKMLCIFIQKSSDMDET